MNIPEIIKALVEADRALSGLEVRGDNVFLLARARSYMKAAFDGLSKPDDPKPEEVKENG